jgi:hypothetical protein
MSRIDRLQSVASELSEDQVDALIAFAESLVGESLYSLAGPEALASVERGLDQVSRGETVSLEELRRRLSGVSGRGS